MNSTTHQKGLSLIELMIALAIGSLLILAITQIFIDNKRNYLFQRSQVNVLENGRYAELLLNEYLAKAGYRRAPDDYPEYAFPARASNSDCLAFTAGSAITATADKQGVCVRYHPMVSGEPDCLGSATTAFTDTKPFTSPASSSIVTLSIKYVPGATLDTGTIACKNVDTGASGSLLSNVADFRLEFGLGANSSSRELISTGDRFVSASSWSVTDGPIRAVRYSLLLASPPNQRDGDSQIFNNWLANSSGATKTRLETGDQNRLYHIAGSTRTVRNLMP